MMATYILKRLALIIPTLFGIMLINFLIVQAAPGGPVEQMMAKLSGHQINSTTRFSGIGQQETLTNTQYRGAQGIDKDLLADIKKSYGFDKPASTRFFIMIKQYATFDFGDSFYRNISVIDLVLEKMPVSISLGLWTTLFVYLLSIPLGIHKAIRHGSSFDLWTSTIIVISYAIPSFLFALLLIIFFAGGSYFDLFPLRGLVSEQWDSFSWWHKITDYLWHITLPICAMVIGGLASLTMLCKNSFLEEIHKQYVLTARAKGLSEGRILYGHVFRNAMLIVIAGFPDALLKVLFTGALLIEVMFSLDGLGLLGFEAAIQRDYPVMFATLYVFTLLGLIFNLIGDLVYVLVDPRIDFNSREAL
jgi:microcin C transport system permease protein